MVISFARVDGERFQAHHLTTTDPATSTHPSSHNPAAEVSRNSSVGVVRIIFICLGSLIP